MTKLHPSWHDMKKIHISRGLSNHILIPFFYYYVDWI